VQFLTAFFGANIPNSGNTVYDVIQYDGLSEISSAGNLLTPYIPGVVPYLPGVEGSIGVYGLSDAPNVDVLGPNNLIVNASIGGTVNQIALAVDADGSLWTVGAAADGSGWPILCRSLCSLAKGGVSRAARPPFVGADSTMVSRQILYRAWRGC